MSQNAETVPALPQDAERSDATAKDAVDAATHTALPASLHASSHEASHQASHQSSHASSHASSRASSHAFSSADIAAVYRAIHERRDMRHFAGGTVPAAQLSRIIDAAHHAPSVGFMQPWRFVRVTDPAIRHALHQIVDTERLATADALGKRRDEFMCLKVQGVLDCAEVLVTGLMEDREQHIFGRRTLPEMDLASLACGIQNMWLAARAEGLGMGWVSLFDADAVRSLLNMPAGAKPVAILCLGPVASFYDEPMLQQEGWAARLDVNRCISENVWPTKPSAVA